jgi:hypothetical protein
LKRIEAQMRAALWQWSATDLTKAIRSREISSREAVESCLARNDQVNARVNAVVDLLGEEALRAADEADAAVRAGDALGPLHGVPVTVKINVDYAGRPTTNGVVAFKNFLPKRTAFQSATFEKPARSFSDAPTYRPFRRGISPTTICTDGRSTLTMQRGPQGDQAAARRRRSPSVLGQSRTATIAQDRFGIPPMPAASAGCGRRSAGCPTSTKQQRGTRRLLAADQRAGAAGAHRLRFARCAVGARRL